MAAWQSAHWHCTVLPAHLPRSSHFVNEQPFSVFKINGKKSKLLLSYKEQILPSAPGARLHSPARQNRQGLPAQLWVRALVLSGGIGEKTGGTERQWEDCAAGRTKGSG